MSQIVLPRFIGTRETAAEILDAWRVRDASGDTVEVLARAVRLATDSFTTAFLEGLHERGVKNVVVFGANKKFEHDLTAFASQNGLDVEIAKAA